MISCAIKSAPSHPEIAESRAEEFAVILPLLPAPSRRARKRTDPLIILNALFYLIRAGCPWRYLPKDFPPFTTVQNQFYAWRDSGLWTQILCVLVMEAREAEGREASPRLDRR